MISTNAAVLGEVFALGGDFPLSIFEIVGSGHGVENYCRPVSSRCRIKNKGGCSFGLFNCAVSCSFGPSA